MIAPKGFVVLSEYVRDIKFAVQEVFEAEDRKPSYPPSFPLQELVEAAMQEVFLRIPRPWIYSASGQLHQVSADILDPLFGRDALGRSLTTFAFFHIDDMKIDLGKMVNHSLELDDPKRVERYLRENICVRLKEYDHQQAGLFAEFDGYYLTVPDGDLPEIDKIEFIKIIRGSDTSNDAMLNERQVEDTLRRFAKNNRTPKRDQFKRDYAPKMKVEAFKAIWRKVSEDYPKLSRSGPKPKS